MDFAKIVDSGEYGQILVLETFRKNRSVYHLTKTDGVVGYSVSEPFFAITSTSAIEILERCRKKSGFVNNDDLSIDRFARLHRSKRYGQILVWITHKSFNVWFHNDRYGLCEVKLEISQIIKKKDFLNRMLNEKSNLEFCEAVVAETLESENISDPSAVVETIM